MLPGFKPLTWTSYSHCFGAVGVWPGALTLPHVLAWRTGVIMAIAEPRSKSHKRCLAHELSKILESKGHGEGFSTLNACMRVARRISGPGKGTTFTGRRIVASRAEISSSGTKSILAGLLMLNAQSFISSPLSTRGIKVLIAEICDNKSCKLLCIWRKSVNYICKILCISQQHLIAIVRRKTREKHHIRQYSHYPS